MNPLVILSWGQRWAVDSRDLCNLSIYIYIYIKQSEDKIYILSTNYTVKQKVDKCKSMKMLKSGVLKTI